MPLEINVYHYILLLNYYLAQCISNNKRAIQSNYQNLVKQTKIIDRNDTQY